MWRPQYSFLVLCLFPACSDEYARAPDVDIGTLCTSCGACEERLAVAGALHVSGTIDYEEIPPVGGPHSQCWTTWGVHEAPVRPENWVHNLEHGGVVLLYHCDDGCEDERSELSSFVNTHPRTVLTEYAPLPQRFAVVSWEHRLVTDCLDLDAFERFYDARFDHGLESIDSDPPAICSARPDL